jgi:hypothetical protein
MPGVSTNKMTTSQGSMYGKAPLTSNAFSKSYAPTANYPNYPKFGHKDEVKSQIPSSDWLMSQGFITLENKPNHNDCFLNSVL